MTTINRRMLLDDCDAAGVVFGPRIAAIAHQAYEEALAQLGVDLAAMLRSGKLGLPYVRLECVFHRPLRHGDVIACVVEIAHLGTTSATFRISLRRDGELCAEVTQVHVAVTMRDTTPAKQPLPPELRDALQRLPAATKG